MIPLPEPMKNYPEPGEATYTADQMHAHAAAARRQALEEAAQVCDERRDLYEATGHPREFTAARACANTIRSLIDKDTA